MLEVPFDDDRAVSPNPHKGFAVRTVADYCDDWDGSFSEANHRDCRRLPILPRDLESGFNKRLTSKCECFLKAVRTVELVAPTQYLGRRRRKCGRREGEQQKTEYPETVHLVGSVLFEKELRWVHYAER